MRVEMSGQRLGDAGNADIPGDVPHPFGGRHPEIAQHARDQPAVMVASEQKRRTSRRIIFPNRRNLFAAEE